MRCKPPASRAPLAALLILAVFVLSGCDHSDEGASISPEPARQDVADLALGPGVRPLSFGPGDKGSPSWSPTGDRIAFTVDGYAADKYPDARDFRRRTTGDLGAEVVRWMSPGKGLAILGTDLASAPGGELPAGEEASRSVYRTLPGEGLLGVERVAAEALAMAPGPGGRSLLVARKTGPDESGLALVRDGGIEQAYADRVEGRISGLSVSPDGDEAVLAVQKDDPRVFELYLFDLSRGAFRRIARPERGLEVFGAPQLTENGIYYVAGEREKDGATALYDDLYRIAEGSGKPEPAAGVGEDFVASSLQVSPKGGRLAVIGRRNPGSATELYVLDLGTERLETLTANENMEIKTGPEDLAWSPDGERVVIVARGVLSEPSVYPAPADALVREFYNLYEVPVASPRGDGEG